MFYGNGKGKFSHRTQKITIKHEWFSIMKYHNFIIVIMVEIVEERNKKRSHFNGFLWQNANRFSHSTNNN